MNKATHQTRCDQRVAVMLDRPTADALRMHQKAVEQRTGARLSLSSTAAALLRQAVQRQASA